MYCNVNTGKSGKKNIKFVLNNLLLILSDTVGDCNDVNADTNTSSVIINACISLYDDVNAV